MQQANQPDQLTSKSYGANPATTAAISLDKPKALPVDALEDVELLLKVANICDARLEEIEDTFSSLPADLRLCRMPGEDSEVLPEKENADVVVVDIL